MGRKPVEKMSPSQCQSIVSWVISISCSELTKAHWVIILSMFMICSTLFYNKTRNSLMFIIWENYPAISCNLSVQLYYWHVYNYVQAMPQLTDRSKLPNIIDPVIKDTMDPKHLYQVLIPNKLLTFSNSDTFIFQQFMLIFHACAGCGSSCSMRATRTELQTADNRCSPLSCSSSALGARGNT
jgi:hypothetical protein